MLFSCRRQTSSNMNGSPEIANSPRQDKPPESRLSFYLLRLQCIQSMQNSIDKSTTKLYQTNIKQIPKKYQPKIKQIPNKYQTNTKQISNKYHICTVSAEFEGDYLSISCGHTLCNQSSGCKLMLTKINRKQILWKFKLISWLKYIFGLIHTLSGNNSAPVHKAKCIDQKHLYLTYCDRLWTRGPITSQVTFK